jgi:hypothetical protein
MECIALPFKHGEAVSLAKFLHKHVVATYSKEKADSFGALDTFKGVF